MENDWALSARVGIIALGIVSVAWAATVSDSNLAASRAEGLSACVQVEGMEYVRGNCRPIQSD